MQGAMYRRTFYWWQSYKAKQLEFGV